MSIRTSSATKLLDAAEELFFTRGIHATPVDAVIERAGVSAATMYRGFASKEALLAAALSRRHTQWIEAWDAAIDRQDSRGARILAVFDALDAFREHPARAQWCAFLGSAAEYADTPAEVREAIDLDSESLRRRLTATIAADRAGGASLEDRRLAEELLLIVSGELAMRLRDAQHTTSTARRIATALIREHEALEHPGTSDRRK